MRRPPRRWWYNAALFVQLAAVSSFMAALVMGLRMPPYVDWAVLINLLIDANVLLAAEYQRRVARPPTIIRRATLDELLAEHRKPAIRELRGDRERPHP